jgi:ABC-type transport system involved in multi-copper enzyme maturation permease subunit
LKLFLAKYLSGMGILTVFTVVSVFSIIPLAALHGVEYKIESFAAVALIVFLFGWSVFSVAMMFSSLFSEKGKVYMACGGTLLAMYVLNVVALMKDNLDALKYLSFFHYYAYSDALIRQSLYGTGCLVFVGVSVACTAIGLSWFLKRDIAV